MSDQKTVIVTGGNSGLGFECARNIAATPGYRVILACRSMEKAERAKAKLIRGTSNPDIQAMELDVSSLASVRDFADRFKGMDLSLHGLVCNAGVNGTTTGQTPDGFDVVFATNHLGHLLLANLLLPLMQPAGRIAVVSSDMHAPPGADLTWLGALALAHPDETFAGSMLRYSYSKLCNLYFTYELSQMLVHTGSHIAVNALNPGLMTDTNFAPDKSRFTSEFLERVSDRIGSLERSAKALADMITDPALSQITGKYFDRGIDIIESSPLSYDTENALELWTTSVELTNLMRDETILS